MSDFNANLVGLTASRALATDASGNPAVLGAGTTTTVLHGNAAGSPSYGAVSLTADVSGTLPIANGGTNLTTYTTGDIIYGSASNVLSKLAIGTTGQSLVVASGIPSWASATVVRGSVHSTAVDYTTLATDFLIIVTDNTSQRTIHLISAATIGAGAVQMIKDGAGTSGSSGNPITVQRATASGQSIDGGVSAQISGDYGVMRVISDGSNWFTF